MAVAITTAMQNQIAQNYIAILGRNPDPAGFAFWVNTYATADATPAALVAITNGFGNSQEFRETYGQRTTSEAVALLYQNVLLRAADAGGLAYWTAYANNLITTGAARSTVEAYAQTGAQIIYNASSQGLSDAASINARTATAVAAGTAAPTTTYTLTTGINEISGRDITVNGLVDFNGGRTPVGTATTYQTADTITGTGGTNTLNLTFQNAATGAITALTAPAVSGMGTVTIRNVSGQAFFATGAGGYDVAGFGTGVTAINSNISTSAIFLQNVANTTSVGIIGNGIATNGNFEAIYAATATAPVLNITGGVLAGDVVVTAAGATSFVVNSTKGLVSATDATGLNTIGTLAAPGAATSTMTINAASSLTTGAITTAVKQITLTGAAKVVTLGAITDANLTTIDASGMSAGGVTVTLIATVTSLTGGAGVDTVTTVSTTGATATISGGAGTADILNVADTTSLSTAALGGRFTNFEILRNGSAAGINVANISGVTALQVNSNAGGFSNMSAAQAAAVTIRGTPTSASLTLADAGGASDVLNLNFNSGTAATAATLASLTATGIETINITATTGASGAASSFDTTGGSLTSLTALNISGAVPFALTTTATEITKAAAVNASGITYTSLSAADYALTYTAALIKGSSITGTNSNDSITFTGAVAGTSGDYVTINGGSGNDLITTTLAAINNTSAGNASLKIEGGVGTDTLATNAGTYVDNNFQFITGIERITVATGAASITTGGFFSTNFSATGVTITAATLGVTGGGAAAANVFDLSTFSGNATIAATQNTNASTDSNVGDSFNITTGSGNDTITLTTDATKGALTSTNVISTGLGNDSVTLTARALGVGGTISVLLGGGNDTFVAGASASSTTGGLGADDMTGGAGVNTFIQTMGDSVAATANTLASTIAVGNTITFANGVDIIRNFTTTADKINTDIDSSGGGGAAIVNAVGQLASAVQTSNFFMRGDYLNGVFTISTTGADTLVSLGKAASTLTFANATDYVLLVGVTTVANGDFI
jgi:hypothetical protein